MKHDEKNFFFAFFFLTFFIIIYIFLFMIYDLFLPEKLDLGD